MKSIRRWRTSLCHTFPIQQNMSAFDSIVARKPRENSGAMAANRFEYQLDWGLRKLLQLEESGLPYTVIFDYHDDILVLDSDKDPNYIDFYQVKTNASATGWSRQQLTQVPKIKEPKVTADVEPTLFDQLQDDVDEDGKYSKLAKLMIHSLDFKKEARDFFFVTNASFGGTMIDGSLNREKEIDFSQLKTKAKDEIIKKVKEELPDLDDGVFERLHIIKNQMDIDDHQVTVIGYLNGFLVSHYPKAKAIAKPVYDTLIQEIRKRNNHEYVPKSKEDLLKNKAFTKEQFHQFLKRLETIENTETKKAIINNYLTSYLPPTASARRRNILKQLQTIREDHLVYDNHEFLRLYSTIDKLLDETAGEQNEWEWSQKVLDRLRVEYSFTTTHSDDYLICLILYEIC